MQTLDIHRPDMPDLQFVLFVTALCTSRLTTLNVPQSLRTTIFNRCWTLIHETPPPRRPEDRVLDLRPWTELTVEAMVETIRAGLTEAGIQILAWDHAPSEPTRASTQKPSLSSNDSRNSILSHPRNSPVAIQPYHRPVTDLLVPDAGFRCGTTEAVEQPQAVPITRLPFSLCPRVD